MKYFVHVPREVILFRQGKKDQQLREGHFHHILASLFFSKDQENREGKGKSGDKQKAEEPRDQIPPPPRNRPAKDKRAGRLLVRKESLRGDEADRIQGGQSQRCHSASHMARAGPTRDRSSTQRPETTLLISFCKTKRFYPSRESHACVF